MENCRFIFSLKKCRFIFGRSANGRRQQLHTISEFVKYCLFFCTLHLPYANRDSIVIAGVGANTMENILNNNQSCLNNYVSDSSKSSSTAYSAIDSLQVNNIILQPSHPYLASSLILFRSMSKKGWVLDEQRIDPMGNFYRITSRLRREAIMSSPATFSTCQNSNDSIFCSDYSLDLESWPLYRESILCSHCCNRQTCSRCRNWINYLRIQRSDIQKRQQAPSLNTNQKGNINSLLTGIEHHLSVLSDRCIQDTVDRSEDWRKSATKYALRWCHNISSKVGWSLSVQAIAQGEDGFANWSRPQNNCHLCRSIF